MNFVRKKDGSGVYRATVSQHDLRKVEIPIIFEIVDDYGKHLSHDVINSSDTAVNIWMLGASGDLTCAKEHV